MPSAPARGARARPAPAHCAPGAAPFVLLVVALLVGTTLGLLVLNTAIAVDSLKATQLRAENAERAQEVQRLEQQVVDRRDAGRARRAPPSPPGLVPAGPAAYLVVAPDGSSMLRGTPVPGPGAGRRRRAGRRLSGAEHPRGPGDGPRSTGRPAGAPPGPRPSHGRVPVRPAPARSDAAGAFTSRRAPGSRRSGAGLSVEQRGMRNRWGLVVLVALLVLVVGRLAVLQGVDGAAYANAAEQDRLRTYPSRRAARRRCSTATASRSPTPSTPPA